VTPEKARRQEALARALGWRRPDEPARDGGGRYVEPERSYGAHGRQPLSPAAVVDWDPGARGVAPHKADALGDHARLIVGLVRARRLGPTEPWRP
jgi:hypothetical protein